MYEGAAQRGKSGGVTGPQGRLPSAALWGICGTSSSGSTPPVVLTCLFLSLPTPIPLPIPLLLGLNLFLPALLLLLRSHLPTTTQATGGWLFWLSL